MSLNGIIWWLSAGGLIWWMSFVGLGGMGGWMVGFSDGRDLTIFFFFLTSIFRRGFFTTGCPLPLWATTSMHAIHLLLLPKISDNPTTAASSGGSSS